MRLRLKSVHLKNFRIHADYTFEPDETGVTAIIGRNGHGKSTIIDGIAWALYGTKPNTGIKNSSWRRIDAPDDENAYVEVAFDLDGRELKIKRTLVGPKASSVTCECWLDGTLEAGPAVSHASRWIINVLQLDEEGFLSTMLVQQKHVGQLVSASRAERRRILERLTGVTAVSTALEKAKEEEKVTKRAASSTEVDEKRIPALRKTIERQVEVRRKAEASMVKTQERLEKLGEEGKAAKVKVDEMEDALARRRGLESQLAVAESSLKTAMARQTDLMARKEELKAELPPVKMAPSEMEDMRRELSEAKDRLTGLQREESTLQARLDSAPTDEAMEAVRSRIKEVSSKAGSYDRGSLESRLDRIRVERAEDDAKINQAGKSLGEIHDGVAKCPTCLQDIEDPSHVKAELDEIIKTAGDHKAALKTEYDGVKSKLSELDGLEASVREAEAELRRLEELRAGLDGVPERLATVRGEIRSAQTVVDSSQAVVNRYEADRVKYDEYERVGSQLSSVMAEISSLEKTVKTCRADLSKIKVDEAALAKARGDLDGKRSKRNDLRVKMSELQGEARVAGSEESAARRELAALEDQAERHKSSLEALEVAATASSLLGKFREHVILSSIPRVTDYASELIESISGGAFTGISIDRSFNITVESGDGVVKSVSQLSGGEEDLVAICLRLGISLMLSDGVPSMLILDEVLTAMDSERAEAILAEMENLSDGQIIIVAHNEIVKSIADKVVEL